MNNQITVYDLTQIKNSTKRTDIFIVPRIGDIVKTQNNVYIVCKGRSELNVSHVLLMNNRCLKRLKGARKRFFEINNKMVKKTAIVVYSVNQEGVFIDE